MAYDPKQVVRREDTFDPSKLAGKSVIITGGASGLGQQFAKDFVSAGAYVTIGDISEENGKKVVSDLGGDEHAVFVKCDVLSWKDQVNLYKTALKRSPSKTIDVVLANAGISGEDAIFSGEEVLDDGDPAEPDISILKINTIGPMYTAALAQRYLPQQPEGESRDKCLIITASLAGYEDLPGSPQYAASKFAVRGLMRSLRQTMPKKDMRVNLIAPWYIRTPIMSEEFANRIASGGVTFAKIEDASAAVQHLASDRSLNGRALAVVTRDIDPRGYVDLATWHQDDPQEGGFLDQVRQSINRTGHRIGTSQ